MSEMDVNDISDEQSKRYNQMKSMCEEWLELCDQQLWPQISDTTDEIKRKYGENVELKANIESKEQKLLQEKRSKYELMVSDGNELSGDLDECRQQLNACVNSLREQLADKKHIKQELTDKSAAIKKKLTELKRAHLELTKENIDMNASECSLLSQLMKVMYKTWNDSKVGLVFNEDENLDRVVIFEKNKTDEEMARDFWKDLNDDYNIN